MTTETTSVSPAEISIKSMLEAGVHFGHQTQRWNPKMMPYIYTKKNGIHIINLDMTMKAWERARKFIVDITSNGGSLLVVGTKLQARMLVEEQSKRAGAFYVSTRWLGGTLSNFQTIRRSIDRMRKMEDFLAKAEDPESKVKIGKKEKLSITKDLGKLQNNLNGIREMRDLPAAVFVTDVSKEMIAVAEARRLRIPVIALVDTNVDPELVDFIIPSNDDAAKSLKLFISGVADAVLEGRSIYGAKMADQPNEKTEGGRGRRGRNSNKEAAVTEAAS